MVKEDYSSMGKRKRAQYLASVGALYGDAECPENAIGGTKASRSPKTRALPCPKESHEAMALFTWAERHPRIGGLLIHIPNEGRRDPITGGRLRRMGMRSGVSDYFLPVPVRPFAGLWLELKRLKGSKTTDEQLNWLAKMREQGYATGIGYGWLDAKRIIEEYLGI